MYNIYSTITEEESHVTDCVVKKDAYYVASSGGPHLVITQVQLRDNIKDNNYEEWAKAMRIALHSKKKLGFIDDLIQKLVNGPDKKEE